MAALIRYTRLAWADFRQNRLVHGLAMSTIGLIFLLAGSFALVVANASSLAGFFENSSRMMVYLDQDAALADVDRVRQALEEDSQVREARFVSRDEALNILKNELGGQSGLLEDLAENPLPDAFDVQLEASADPGKNLVQAGARFTALDGVSDVEYGGQWLDRLNLFLSLAKASVAALLLLLAATAVFITANTIRLVLYNRTEEIRILRLVGATESFIRGPFYIQGIFQGLVASGAALLILWLVYLAAASQLAPGLYLGEWQPRFLSLLAVFSLLAAGALSGLLGSFLSFALLAKKGSS